MLSAISRPIGMFRRKLSARLNSLEVEKKGARA